MTNASGATYYYVTNFRGDVIRIMDASGNSVASYSYDPWGKVLSVSGNSAVTGQPIRYASYVYHPDGLRKSKTVGSTTYNYHYELIKIISDRS